MSTEEEVLFDGQLNLSAVELELQFATVGLDALAEGVQTEGGHVALQVVHEVHFLYVQVTILGMKFGIVKAHVGAADDKGHNITLVLWVRIASLCNLNKLRLKVSFCGEEGCAER